MNFIPYYRVSTTKQGADGLGINGQKKAIQAYIATISGKVIAEYQDVESGANTQRKGLQKAIQHAKESGATLIVHKLDRLTRDGFAIVVLLDNMGVEWVEADSPNDTELVRNIKLSVAKDERDRAKQRTKSALGVIKDKINEQGHYISRRGNKITQLGKAENLGGEKAIRNSIRARQAKAANDPRNKMAVAFIKNGKAANKSFYRITMELNEAGFLTSRGNAFSVQAVKKLNQRIKT